jgi:aryl-phospho-beta-D-glucosidase BglC (GH1 family)
VFQHDVGGKLSKSWSWPVQQFIAIMNLTGDKTVRISDSGATKITVDSGIAVYNYILPAQSK